LHDQTEQLLRLVQSRTSLLSALTVAPEDQPAHDRRMLAQRLMAQSLLDLQTYSASADEDALADARINLTESLKQLVAAKTAPSKG